MKYKFISVAVLDPTQGEEALNQFLASHQVISIEKELIQAGQNPCWAFAISYREGQQVSEAKRPVVDYKAILNDEDFTRFAQLRELRNRLAKQEGRPAYAVFTHEQLANLVTGRVTTRAGMANIEGIARVPTATGWRNRTRQHPDMAGNRLSCKYQGCRGVSNQHESPPRNCFYFSSS